MSDQTVTTASVQTAQPAPPQPPPRAIDPAEEQARTGAIMALLNACTLAAQSGAAAQAAQDTQDFSRSALQFAQAAVILDPNLVAPQGVPPNALHPPLPHIQMQQQPKPAPAQGGSGGQ